MTLNIDELAEKLFVSYMSNISATSDIPTKKQIKGQAIFAIESAKIFIEALNEYCKNIELDISDDDT